MESRYNQEEIESRIYKQWEDSGFFRPEVCIEKGIAEPEAESFSIVLPPPNVTGVLHMGHAAMLAIEDILVRYHRMRGHRTLWLPGTDHAAIATQSKVEKLVEKEEGKRKYDLGREEFLKRVHKFAKESHDTIATQVRRMGASVDWTREAFTLDEPRTLAVRTAFKKMFDAGLIYRAHRVVNWDPKGQTVISDDELVYEERNAKFYTFKYSKDFPISISTTRPETKVGDTAVAVHPSDERYKGFIGKEYDLVFCGVPLHIKVIADESVDKEFGTGALGVTPAHSMIDWEMAQKHDLPLIQVIDERAKMMVQGELNGKKTTEAREIIVEKLRQEGLLEKEEEVKQNVSTAERTGAIVEPLPKLQWFVAVNKKFKLENSKIEGLPTGSEVTLKELMIKVVENGQIKILPERFERVYYHWIENLRDWCISRQIWYGHQIPVWYRGDELYAGLNAPEGDGWTQDQDTLDTWFSSGLWTFSTLGWPDKELMQKEGFHVYHPTAVLETGYDILFFWVARMILMTGFILEEIPFRTVYLHGLVRDEKGRKMSKSLGNAIDPLQMIEKYGADATRLSLIIGAAPGNDIKLSEDRVRGYRNFTTKIWNAARFVLMNRPSDDSIRPELNEEQKKDLENFETFKAEIDGHIENFELHLAGEKAYHYFWHTFADVLIEREKNHLRGEEAEAKARSYLFLETILSGSLKVLHPFMPFITEDIWQILYPGHMLMVESWK